MYYLYLFIVLVVLLKIAYVDFKEHSIYDLDILIVSLVICVFNIYCFNLVPMLLGGAIGFVIGYVIYSVAFYVYKEEAFGFGDVLLLGSLGMFFGYPVFLHYFAITIMAIGIIAALLILYDSKYRKMEIPMAPVFIFGAFTYVICGYPSLEDIFFHIFLFYYSLV